MKSFIRHFLDSCLRSLAAIGQSELTKWGYNEQVTLNFIGNENI